MYVGACASLKEVKKEAGGCSSASVSVPVNLGCLHCLDIEMGWTEKMQARFYG